MSDKSLPENAGSPAAGVQPSSFGRRKSNLADTPKRRAADEVGSPGVDQHPAANPLPPTEGAEVKIEELAALAAGVGAERPESGRQGAADTGIIVTTTNSVEGHRIAEYLGLVSGEAILGANLFKDMFASITDIVGGRSGSYEVELTKARGIAVQDMIDSAMFRDADAIVGVDIDYEVLSMRGSMLMVMANGTAVKLVPDS